MTTTNEAYEENWDEDDEGAWEDDDFIDEDEFDEEAADDIVVDDDAADIPSDPRWDALKGLVENDNN